MTFTEIKWKMNTIETMATNHLFFPLSRIFPNGKSRCCFNLSQVVTHFCLSCIHVGCVYLYDTIDFFYALFLSFASFYENKNCSATINLQIKCLYESSRLFVHINIRIYNYSDHDISVYYDSCLVGWLACMYVCVWVVVVFHFIALAFYNSLLGMRF